MSATGRPGRSTRTEADFYGTPAWCVDRLLFVQSFLYTRILEPCAGDGAIVRAVQAHYRSPLWTCVEIRPEAAPTLAPLAPGRVAIGDFLSVELEDAEFEAVITNPPYELAMEFVQKIVGKVDVAAFLLRLNFLASEDRAEFMREHPPDVLVIPNRPCFKRVWSQGPKGWKLTTSDATEYAWFVWPREDRDFGEVRVLAPTPEDVRAAAREQVPVEDKDGRILWTPSMRCEDCFGQTAWRGGAIVCSNGHARTAASR